MKVNLVAAINPEGPAVSGVRSYVLALARELTIMGVDVCVLGFGPRAGKKDGYEFVPVADRVETSSQYVFALARFLKRERHFKGIVHGNRPDDLLPFHLEAPDLPTTVTLHGVHGLHVRAKHGLLASTAYRLAERYSLNRARLILCVSPDTLSYFNGRYPSIAKRFRWVPPGVDMDLFQPRSKEQARAHLHISENKKLVAFVGRFEPEKNPIGVAEEFLSFRKAHADARLAMVGVGKLEPVIRRLASAFPELISLFPPMSQSELAWFLNAADILAVGSNHEGLPTVAIEALASGTPVVGTSVGILPHVIESGTNGFLVDSTSQLRTFMEKALYEVDWVEDACRASVRMFGWDRVAPAVLEVYREVST